MVQTGRKEAINIKAHLTEDDEANESDVEHMETSTTENSTKPAIPGTESRRLACGPDNDGHEALHPGGSDDEMAIQKDRRGMAQT